MQNIIDKIDMKLAKEAFSGTSFTPDKRGAAYVESFVERVKTLGTNLRSIANSDKQTELVDRELKRAEIALLTAFIDVLHAHRRLLSPMITGRANFPVARNQKNLRSHSTKSQALDNLFEKIEKSITKKVKTLDVEERGGLEVVKNTELEALKRDHRDIKAMNKLLRQEATKEELLEKVEGLDEKRFIYLADKYHLSGTFPAFVMSNLYARIKSRENNIALKARLKEKAKVQPQETLTEFEFTDGEQARKCEMIRNYEAERYQIVFCSKPSREVINLLKGSAWRWSPSANAWQRKITCDALYSLRRIKSAISPKSDE